MSEPDYAQVINNAIEGVRSLGVAFSDLGDVLTSFEEFMTPDTAMRDTSGIVWSDLLKQIEKEGKR